MANRKTALPTQKFIDIEGTQDGILVLKNGGLRQILAVSGINFDLKSEDEQNAITHAYQNFLNSLNFAIQIFVHSRKVNIDGYLEGIKKLQAVETNPLLKTQIGEYGEFIRSFVNENAIMNKSFFVVVQYDPVRIPGSKKGGLLGKRKKKKGKEKPVKENKSLARNISQLKQRTEQILSGLTQMGLRTVPLNDDESIELFYNLYNPESIEKKGLEVNQNEQKTT